MPNILTHTYITAEVLGGSDPDLLLGSALPDFLGMYHDLVGGTLRHQDIGGRALQEGIGFHIATDDAFDHGNPLKSLLVGAAAADFASNEAPTPRAVKLYCSDPGTEILLDGVVQQNRSVSDMFLNLADDVVNDRTSLNAATSDQTFIEFVKRYFERGIPVAYEDPMFVAQLLQKRLADRARRKGRPVSFNEDHIPVVAGVFKAQIGRLQEYGGVMLGQLTHTLKARRVARDTGLVVPETKGVQAAVGHVSGLEAEALLYPGADDELRSMRPASIHGRVLLRQLLSNTGVKAYVGKSNANGLPMPEGSRGSISHARSGWVVAAVADAADHAGLGVDIEQLEGRRDITSRVCLPEETGLDIPSLAVVVASAKEAAYKAFSRVTNGGLGRYVGFRELRLGLVGQEESVLHLRGLPESDQLRTELAGFSLDIAVRLAGGHAIALATLD